MTEIASKLLWAVFGAYVAWSADQLGVGTFGEPGPGMLGVGLGGLMVLVSLGSLAFSLRAGKRPAGGEAAPGLGRAEILRVGALVAMMLVYIAALEPVGFLLSTAIFLFVLLATLGGVRWPKAGTIALAVALIAYFGFKSGLEVQLPAGILG